MPVSVVLTSVPDLKTARSLARTLVAKKLAACVTISAPAESLYRWKGRLTAGSERLVWVKTSAALYRRLEKEIIRNHPYKVPEVLEWKATRVSAKYLSWLAGSLK